MQQTDKLNQGFIHYLAKILMEKETAKEKLPSEKAVKKAAKKISPKATRKQIKGSLRKSSSYAAAREKKYKDEELNMREKI